MLPPAHRPSHSANRAQKIGERKRRHPNFRGCADIRYPCSEHPNPPPKLANPSTKVPPPHSDLPHPCPELLTPRSAIPTLSSEVLTPPTNSPIPSFDSLNPPSKVPNTYSKPLFPASSRAPRGSWRLLRFVSGLIWRDDRVGRSAETSTITARLDASIDNCRFSGFCLQRRG